MRNTLQCWKWRSCKTQKQPLNSHNSHAGQMCKRLPSSGPQGQTKKLQSWLLIILVCLSFPTLSLASPYSFGGGACKTQGSWTENALTATRDLTVIIDGLRNAEGCGQLANSLEGYLKDLDGNLSSVNQFKTQSSKISSLQDEILAQRQYAQDPNLGALSSRSMVAGMNELAALSLINTNQAAANDSQFSAKNNASQIMPNLGDQVFRVGKTGIHIANKILDALNTEEMKCLSSPNLAGPFFTALVQLSASMVNSGQDYFGKDVSSLVNKITLLARNTHFDRISRDIQWLQFQNSMSCLIDTLAEGYCTALDAQVIFNEQMKRYKPISWAWNVVDPQNAVTTPPVQTGDFDKLKRSMFEGYYVLTQQLPVVTAFLERIQRGIPPKNHSDANFQNKIQYNTFSYFLNERNILADWNEARTTISHMTNIESQKSAIADTLKKIGHLIIGPRDDTSGVNFLERVTNGRKVIFQLMGKEIPAEVVGKNGMQIKADDWLDVNYSQFIGDPNDAMAEISKNLDSLLTSANEAAVEYYNYWFIADQPGLMIDSITGMTYNIPEALEAIKQYLEHFSKQDYVDSSVLPAVFETIEKINRILSQYELLRATGVELKNRYGDLDKYPLEERKVILQTAMAQYKDLIEIFYNEFIILKARSSFLINRLTSFVKIDYQKRLRLENKGTEDDNELLRQIYYATGDIVFERMRLISSKNPAEIDSDLNSAQRTYLETLRALEDLIRDSFVASIAQMKLQIAGLDTTTSGIFEDSMIRANQAADANSLIRFQRWLFERLYDGLPQFLKPQSKHNWDYYSADKLYGTAIMIFNPDRYPGIYALNPVRIFTKEEAPGVVENSNGAIQKTLALYCIQSLTFRDSRPFADLCKGVVLKSPLIEDEIRAKNEKIPYLNFLDVPYDLIRSAYLNNTPTMARDPNDHKTPQLYPDFLVDLPEASQRQSKNFDARVCALRQRNRNNYIMYLTQGRYINH